MSDYCSKKNQGYRLAYCFNLWTLLEFAVQNLQFDAPFSDQRVSDCALSTVNKVLLVYLCQCCNLIGSAISRAFSVIS